MLTLFLHPLSTAQRIADLYKRAFDEAVELYVLSVYLRIPTSARRAFFVQWNRCGTLHFLRLGSEVNLPPRPTNAIPLLLRGRLDNLDT
jgi:hypothetical protein